MGFLTGLLSGVTAFATGGLSAALTAAAPDIIGGVFAAKSASMARSQAISDGQNKFVDLRNAAIKGGFNPLTALEATGGAGYGAGAYPSSAPPLASVELLTGALRSGAAELDGSAARQRSTDRLTNDLARIKLDQARSGVFVPPASRRLAVASVSPVKLQPLSGTNQVVEQFVTVHNGATGNLYRYVNPDLMDTGAGELIAGSLALAAAESGEVAARTVTGNNASGSPGSATPIREYLNSLVTRPAPPKYAVPIGPSRPRYPFVDGAMPHTGVSNNSARFSRENPDF